MTTAAELLRSAQPPADDGLIDKAIADLDARIWEWTDALKSAHAQLRAAFAARPPARPSESLFESVPQGFSSARSALKETIGASDATDTPIAEVAAPAALPPEVAEALAEATGTGDAPVPPMPASLKEAAAAAHIPSPPPMPASLKEAAAAALIPSPPPMPAEWTAPPAPPTQNSPAWTPAHGGHGMSANEPSAPMPAAWPEPPGFRGEAPSAGVMQWPSAPGAASWPDPSGQKSPTGSQEWPTWTPAGSSTPKKTLTGPPKKAVKPSKAVFDGPTPEERAQKAAAEEATLAQLDDAVARRVRLLRRLDPDTPVEKLIEKAKQGQAEAAAQSPAREEKSSSSWWRRK